MRVGRARTVVGPGVSVVSVVAAAATEDDVKIEPTDDGKFFDLVFDEEKKKDYKAGRVGTDQEFIRFDGWGRIRFSEEAWNQVFREVSKQVAVQVQAGPFSGPLVRNVNVTISRLADVSPAGREALKALVVEAEAAVDGPPEPQARLRELAQAVRKAFNLRDA